MNIAVDIGNDSMKVALYDKGAIERSFKSKCIDYELIKSELWGFRANVERAMISSTRGEPAGLRDFLHTFICDVSILDYKIKTPFANGYDTPETLGSDRLAAVAGAYEKCGGENAMVIDAGSAITYEYLIDNKYEGGNISPGISMRIKALHSFTAKLPFVELSDCFSSPGKNTRDAIIAGVIYGVIYEINEYIRTFLVLNKGAKVLITGGDACLLKDKIKFPVSYVPDIVTDGLNFLMEYNAK